MSVERLKRDFLSAAQKYKKLFKENANPDDLDSFKRLMDAYFHLDDIAYDEIQDLQSVTDEGNTTTNEIIAGVLKSKDSSNRSVSITASNNTVINWSNGSLDTQRGGVTISRLSGAGGVGYFVQKLNVNVPNVITNLNAALGVRGSGTSSSTTALRVENSSAIASLVVNDAGNVLIGTTTDSGEKLQVAGNIKIIGNDQRIYGPSNTEYIRFYTPGNFLILKGQNGVRIDGNLRAGGLYESDGTSAFVFYPNYDGIDKVTRFYNTFVHEDSTDPFAISRGDLEFRIDSNNDSTTSAFKITKDAGTELMRINEDGNVGIGTSSPSQKLHVDGTVYAVNGFKVSNGYSIGAIGSNSALRFNNDNILFNNSSANEAVRFVASTGNVLIGTNTDAGYKLDVNGTARVTGDLTVDTNTLFVDTTNDRVGIGTTTPYWDLHVNGNTRAAVFGYSTPWTSDAVVYIGSYYPTHRPLIVKHHSSTAVSNSHFFAQFRNGDDDDVIQLRADGSADFAGNVGIGTTSPSYKLDVNGTARAVKSKIDFTPTSDTIALDIRGTGTPNDYFTVSNATGGANDVFLPIFFYKAATYGYNGGTNRYPSGVYGGGFIAAVDDTSYPSSTGAGAAMHFNSRAYANNGPLSNRYLFSWGSWLTTHMAMTAGGNLLIGKTTDSGEELQVDGSADVSGDINADGDFYQNGAQGWSGTINIPTNPPVTITVQGGIITNVT